MEHALKGELEGCKARLAWLQAHGCGNNPQAAMIRRKVRRILTVQAAWGMVDET
jgi:hypothetical protein